MTNREVIARAIHAADETHRHEPWDDVKGSYRAMADAAIAAMQDDMRAEEWLRQHREWEQKREATQ